MLFNKYNFFFECLRLNSDFKKDLLSIGEVS